MAGECTDQSPKMFQPNKGGMGGLTIEAWTVILGVIGAVVFGTLYILSSILRDAVRRVDLYKKVAELRADYARQIAEMEAQGHKRPQFAEVIDFRPAVRKAA